MDVNEQLDALNDEKRKLTEEVVALECQIAYSSNVTSKYAALSQLELLHYRLYAIEDQYRSLVLENIKKNNSFWRRLFRK